MSVLPYLCVSKCVTIAVDLLLSNISVFRTCYNQICHRYRMLVVIKNVIVAVLVIKM